MLVILWPVGVSPGSTVDQDLFEITHIGHITLHVVEITAGREVLLMFSMEL